MRWLWRAVSTGLLAGATVGVIESLTILTSAGAGEYDALFWGTLVYAVAGLGLGLILFPFWVFWPWFKAQRPSSTWSGLFVLTMLLLQGASSYGGWQWEWMWLWGLMAPIGIWLGDILLRRTPLKILPHPRGSTAMMFFLLLVTGVFSLTPSRPLPPLEPELTEQPRPNILVLMIDGLRSDHLQVGISPALDRFIQDSVYYDHAFSHAPVSAPSVAALLSSEAQAHAAPLEARHELLSEVLLQHGYHTSAVVNHISLGRFSNFHQGFSQFHYLPPESPVAFTEGTRRLRLIERLLAWWAMRGAPRPEKQYRPAHDVMLQVQQQIIRHQDQRWFVMAQLRDTQEPLYIQGARGVYRPPIWVRQHNLPDVYRAYVAELRRVDDALGALLAWLRQQDMYHNTMIVVTASHATALKSGHALGPSPHRERLQVPLIIKMPNSEGSGAQSPRPVQLQDVAPTVAQYVGAQRPERWQGTDILADAFKNSKEPRPIFAAYDAPQAGWSMVQHRGWKLVRHQRSHQPDMLYDLRQDPDERESVLGHHQEIYSELSSLLKQMEH